MICIYFVCTVQLVYRASPKNSISKGTLVPELSFQDICISAEMIPAAEPKSTLCFHTLHLQHLSAVKPQQANTSRGQKDKQLCLFIVQKFYTM